MASLFPLLPSVLLFLILPLLSLGHLLWSARQRWSIGRDRALSTSPVPSRVLLLSSVVAMMISRSALSSVLLSLITALFLSALTTCCLTSSRPGSRLTCWVQLQSLGQVMRVELGVELTSPARTSLVTFRARVFGLFAFSGRLSCNTSRFGPLLFLTRGPV